MRIFLTGFMGSGKSHTGQQLAELLAYPFFDLDEQIEIAAGCSISALFADQGEAAFRRLEQQQLHQMRKYEEVVVATGGGTACYFDNMEWMNAHGCSIYLKASPLLLKERLKNGMAARPLLAGLDELALLSFIESKLEARRAFYEQAHIVFEQSEVEEKVAPQLLPLLPGH